MPPGRPTPPLFDLLPKTGAADALPSAPHAPAARTASEKPVVRVDLVAQAPPPPPPAAVGPSPAASGSGMGRALEPLMAGPTVIVPRNAILVGIAVLILLAIGIWVLGVRFGVSQERAEVAREFGGAQPPIRDPLAAPADPEVGGSPSGTDTGGGRTGGERRPAATRTQTPPENRPTGGSQPPAVTPGADPRVAGLNYYAIVLVPQEKAAEIVQFLADNGVQSFAIPERVDTGGRGANNDDPSEVNYRVFLLPGITGEEYRARDPKRVQVESAVGRLTEAWKRERRTGNLVAQPGWYKYNR